MIEIRRHSGASPWTYVRLDARQRAVAEEIAQRPEAQGALLVSELAPVITLGRRSCRPTDLTMSPEELSARGIEIYPTDRGGLATYHGPGQWVLFPVDRLDALTGDRRGVRKAVEGLLDAAVETARAFGVPAQTRWGAETGVWSPKGKIASVGIKLERGILLHGLALNVFRTETSFIGIRPCGLDAAADYLLGDVLIQGNGTADAERAARDERFMRVGERLMDAVLARFWV